MGIFKKLIGLLLIVIIFLLLINMSSIARGLNTIVLGPVKSPTQLGSFYATNGASVSGIFEILNPQGVNKTFGGVTLSKTGTMVTLVTENIVIPQGNWALWLTDTPNISGQTNYVDFGSITKPLDYKEYSVGVPESFVVGSYRYIMIINPENYTIFAVAVLKK